MLSGIFILPFVAPSVRAYTWALEAVDPANPDEGPWSAIAVDSLGRPHVSYIGVGSLKYAYRDPAGWWRIEVVDSTVQPWSLTSIALDWLDRPHISYNDRDNKDLRYARWNGTGWEIEVVDSVGDVGYESSLALDSLGRPHITYGVHENGTVAIRYAQWNGTAWAFHDLDYPREAEDSSLALDSSDMPHITFRDVLQADLIYATWNGSVWAVRPVDPSGDSGRRSSLVIDSLDRPHVAYSTDYFPTPDAQLRYASWNGVAWTIEKAGDRQPGTEGYSHVSLALDSSGNPAIAHSRTRLIYVWKSGGVWYNETVDPATGTTVRSMSLALDPSGLPHISYDYDGNRQGLLYAAVVSPPRPDLTLSAGDIVLDPFGPVADGTIVNITATIRNVGGADATGVEARFYDGRPPSAVPIDGDQGLGTIASGGSATASVAWTASPIGPHEVCVLADPDGVVPESDDGNNLACVPVTVLAPPDLAILLIAVDPAPPLADGTVARVDVTVGNGGDLPAGGFDVLVFDDADGNGLPGGGEGVGFVPVPGLAAGAQANVTVPWTASPPGPHRVCAYADPPPGAVAEGDEGNNVACADALVEPGPVLRPDYAPVSPQPAGTMRAGLSQSVTLSVEVRNGGNATANRTATLAFYDASAPAAPFATFPIPPLAPSETSARFTASWTSPTTPGTYTLIADVDYADDLEEWDEANNAYAWTVEVLAGPVTNLIVGTPSHVAAKTYVRSATPLSFAVVDQSGAGIRNTTYRVDGAGPWTNYTASGPFTLSGEGPHLVEWRSEDFAGNVEPLAGASLVVDDTPPAIDLAVGEPKHAGTDLFVTSATLFTMTASDGGVDPVGLAALEYRVNGDPWTAYGAPFSVGGADGPKAIGYRAADLLGNVAEEAVAVALDDTPPTTTPSRADGTYPPGTTLEFPAADGGSGVARTEVRVDGGAWTMYAAPIELPEGVHTIRFRSVDNLGNTEEERILSVTIEGEPPPTTPRETNWKPLVAAFFAAVLAVVGVWSTSRVPTKTGSRRHLRAFVLTALPFVVLEAATGVVSLLTGWLSIPPILGLGAAVDIGILVAGVAVLVHRVRKWTPPK